MLEHYTPDLVAKRLEDVDLEALASRGIEALLLDLDNTVCPWQEETIAESCEEWIRRAKERFKLCFLTNSIRPHRLQRVADRLGIPAVRRWLRGRKPYREGFVAALREVGVEPAHAAMLGDQIMTDVLGGNRLGLYTVWVLPLQAREFIGTKPARCLEKLLVIKFRRLGLMP